jgi:penicillin-binding protein 1C
MKVNSFRRAIWIVDGGCLLLFLMFLFSLPKQLFDAPTSYVVEASNGELLSASIASDGQWRFPVQDTVPVKFVKCITAYEDQRFFLHFGIDPVAMARAFRQNVRAGSVVSGGSTLTMQVIRLSRNKNRNIGQKLIEMWMAMRLEFSKSKAEILGLYSANAPFGGNVIGLSAASWRYYGRKPANLSWGEMATLAVLPNSPALVHPGKNTHKLLKKRNDLLEKLVQLRVIDQQTADLAKSEPLPAQPIPLPQNAPHLLNRFKAERAGLNITTTRLTSTLDYNLQLKVNALLKRYQNRYRANDINNIAALIIDVATGTVKSYVGNIYQPENAALESHVDMIKAPRSPGSTLKPILYASMLSDGMILPRTLIADVPTQIAGYTPQNYDLGYDGAIGANKALSRSLNIPAVKMLQQYKYERFYDKLKKLNFSTLNLPADHYGLSLILGGSEVTLWDLASAYLGMARTLNHFNAYQGKYNAQDYNAPRYENQPRQSNEEQLLEPNAALDHGAIWATFNAMEEVMRPGDEGLWEQFSSAERIAWKTGTSFGFRDAWAVGLTTRYVVCVWVGNADGEGRPGLVGIETAAPVLFDIFRELSTSPWFKMPKTKLKQMMVCKESGFKAGEYCTTRVAEMVPTAGEKTQLCPYHKLIHLDATGSFRVTAQCESTSSMQHQNWFVLPPAMEYYYQVKHSDYHVLPPFKQGCDGLGTTVSMEMIYPKNNAFIYIPIELDGTRGKIILTAAHRNPGTKIYWHLDGNYLGQTTAFHQFSISPVPGKHVLTLVDENGERLVQTVSILAKDKKADMNN